MKNILIILIHKLSAICSQADSIMLKMNPPPLPQVENYMKLLQGCEIGS